MQNRTRAAIVATAIVGVAAVGGGVALAASGGDDDGTETSITGEELDRASAAALEHTGEGLQGRERRAGRGVPRRRLTVGSPGPPAGHGWSASWACRAR